MARHHFAGIVVTACLAVALAACSSNEISYAPALSSIRYVRTRPVTRPPSPYGMGLSYVIPQPSDPRQRPRMSMVSLRAVNETTFVCDFPGIFRDIPADTECTFWVNDEEVSEESVASDIYVNGTRIRVERFTDGVTGGTMERGRFKVSEDGRVY
jgi:hypothetical protein